MRRVKCLFVTANPRKTEEGFLKNYTFWYFRPKNCRLENARLYAIFFLMKHFYHLGFVLVLIASALCACSGSFEKADALSPDSLVSNFTVPAQQLPQGKGKPAHATEGYRRAEEMVAQGFRRYGIEKGALIFRLDGAVSGTEHLYFDNWGWREAKYTRTTTLAGAYQEHTNEVQYMDGEFRYLYDAGTETAYYFESPQIQQSAEKYHTKNMLAVGVEMLKEMGAQPAGNGKIGDIDCEIWKIKKYRTTLYLWQRLTLLEQSFPGNHPLRRVCVQVKTDETIPMEKLTLPAEVKIVRPNQ